MQPRRASIGLGMLLAASLLAAVPAKAQCILANPSFELGGSGGAVFGGWNQFGAVGSSTTASHGARAARVSGPNSGSWDVSAFWQRLDTAPGDRWRATGQVRHPASKPLTGQCTALVNIEWRDAADQLLSYESFAVATPATPTDTYAAFAVESGAAPAGTVAAHILFGVLQSPGDPSPDVLYDQVTFSSATPPTIDDMQWFDFPGGRTVTFGGRTWRVKGPGFYGPGPNVFGDGPECVWTDDDGHLHLTLANHDGVWKSTEVVAEESLGYGDYILTTAGRLDRVDPQAVLGIFLWEYGPCCDDAYTWWNAYNEVDIEYSRWGDPGAAIAQFVAQPFDFPGNLDRFDATFAAGEIASHAMRWLHDRVEYRVWRGGPGDESPATLIHAWTYTGPHLPRPEQPRMHLNLWKLGGTPAGDQEVVFTDFRFVPEGVASAVGDLAAAPGGRLLGARPNPFNPRTTVRFELASDQPIALDVYDLTGRRVRRLANGAFAAGQHGVDWDGRDDRGRSLASGIYLVRLQGQDFVEGRRVTLVQ
ncbi:MAG: FlgD immunoglobulin-like domain containing protein [Candidatus Krumholzibacteriia bacterium]